MERRRSLIKEFDWVLLGIYLALVIMGSFSIFAATFRSFDSVSLTDVFSLNNSFGRQLVWMGLTLVLAIFLLLIDTKVYTALPYPIYISVVTLLIIVLVLGSTIKGSKSWFSLGPANLQPSEFAKLGTCLVLAKFLSNQLTNLNNRKDKLKAFGLIGLPAALVLLQGDLGSTLVFFSFVILLYREGLEAYFPALGIYILVISFVTLLIGNIWVIVGLAVLFLVVLFLMRNNKAFKNILIVTSIIFLVSSVYVSSVSYAFEKVLKPHQKERINVLLGKGGDDWNVRQSKIAIGSGGWFGKGFMKGTQTRFDFVPEQNTDFIFCTIGEEQGFLGSLILVGLFVALFLRLIFVANRQRSMFSRCFGYGVLGIFFVHFAINVGMTIGLAPVIGIPLPFISYGGSSFLAFSTMLLIMVRLDADRLHTLR